MGKEREPFWAYDEDHDDFADDLADEDSLLAERDEFGFEEFGCAFGAACCMPGYHFPSECHTAEMAEEYHREQQAGGE